MSVTLKQKQDKEKSEEEKKIRLIADISHDIRTPLTSAIGYTELIRENSFKDTDKCNEYMEVINRRLQDMKTMVEQLFEYTSLNQVDYVLTKERTDLVVLLRYIDSEYGRTYRHNHLGWSLEFDADKIIVNTDTEKIMRALSNLLDNANKYAEKGTEVRMSVKEYTDSVIISLSNGVTPEKEIDETKIFDRFYKADQARTGATSTGLGLPIVKRIVELHGGSIQVMKSVGRVEFVVMLPKDI